MIIIIIWAPRLATLAASGFPLIVRGRKTVGSIVAVSSFLRSLCRSCCPAASTLAGYPLQSLAQFPSGLRKGLCHISISSNFQITFFVIRRHIGCWLICTLLVLVAGCHLFLNKDEEFSSSTKLSRTCYSNQSYSILFCVRDCSENTAKTEALGHRERQSDRRKLLPATMSPISQRLRSCSGKPDGEHSEPERPNKKKILIIFRNIKAVI